MDNKRDIKKTEKISHFVDKQTIKTHPFGENRMAERAYRKAERLVAAIYLLTNHVDPDEPIRKVVRERSVSILPDILSVRDEMRTVGSNKVHSIEIAIRHLISLVRILAVSGFVSFENADILTDALDDLGSFIETSRRSVLSENTRLSRDDLLNVHENIKDIKDNISIKDVYSVKDNTNHLNDVRYKVPSDSVITGVRPIESATINRRMEGILEVLRAGVDMGIKEIAVNLPEYSEKMIQRELADLIAMGRVKKLGLRRWSKYVLAGSEESLKGPVL